MNRRRRRSGPELVIISWRDIPAQVTATNGENKATLVLSDRFQHAIDRAAAVAGLTETKAYVNEWRRATRPLLSDELAAEVATITAGLEADYSRARLESIVAGGGLDSALTSTD
jgi:hypothetical protein